MAIEPNEDQLWDEFCVHDLPLDRYCPDCFQEYNDEYLRLVQVIVDPTVYKEPDKPVGEEEIEEVENAP